MKLTQKELDILEHLFDIVQSLDGAGLVITDDEEVKRELESEAEFIFSGLRTAERRDRAFNTPE